MAIFNRSKEKLDKLTKLNRIMAVVHAVQGLIILAISSDFTRTITTDFLTFNEATETLEPASTGVFDLKFAPMIALFFFISSAAHTYIGWIANDKYRENIKNGLNPARWYEYSLSASIMMVAIAILAGVFDLSSLIMIFVLTSVMNLMGLVMEVHNQTTKNTNWLSYWIGCLAGIVPWIVVGIYFIGAANEGGGASTIPAFVYWIYVSIFLFFNSFAINMALQYRGVGKWKDYMYGEQSYIWLSLVAKSLLAWQVYAGALQP